MQGDYVLACVALAKARILLAAGGWHRLISALPRTRSAAIALNALEQTKIAEACLEAASGVPFRTACVERSFATCSLLRKRGVAAEFCVGIRSAPPLEFHAWVEVAGVAVNDTLTKRSRFVVLSRH